MREKIFKGGWYEWMCETRGFKGSVGPRWSRELKTSPQLLLTTSVPRLCCSSTVGGTWCKHRSAQKEKHLLLCRPLISQHDPDLLFSKTQGVLGVSTSKLLPFQSSLHFCKHGRPTHLLPHICSHISSPHPVPRMVRSVLGWSDPSSYHPLHHYYVLLRIAVIQMRIVPWVQAPDVGGETGAYLPGGDCSQISTWLGTWNTVQILVCVCVCVCVLCVCVCVLGGEGRGCYWWEWSCTGGDSVWGRKGESGRWWRSLHAPVHTHITLAQTHTHPSHTHTHTHLLLVTLSLSHWQNLPVFPCFIKRHIHICNISRDLKGPRSPNRHMSAPEKEKLERNHRSQWLLAACKIWWDTHTHTHTHTHTLWNSNVPPWFRLTHIKVPETKTQLES